MGYGHVGGIFTDISGKLPVRGVFTRKRFCALAFLRIFLVNGYAYNLHFTDNTGKWDHPKRTKKKEEWNSKKQLNSVGKKILTKKDQKNSDQLFENGVVKKIKNMGVQQDRFSISCDLTILLY